MELNDSNPCFHSDGKKPPRVKHPLSVKRGIMANENRPLIAPMTNEQRKKEDDILRQLRIAESETVCEMLEQALTPDGLQAVIENASGFAETMSQKFRDPGTPPAACKEGCCWCCYQPVPVTAPESFRITRFLETEKLKDDKKAVVNRLHKLDKQTRGLTSKKRAKIPMPCAFLKDDRCLVYSVRPLACAEFTSFNVRDCKRGKRVGFKPKSIIHEKARMLVYRAVQQGLAEGLSRALPKSYSSPLELTAAIVCVLDSTNAEASWIEGAKIFAGAHLV